MLYPKGYTAELQAETERCRSFLLAMHAEGEADQQAGDRDSASPELDSARRPEGSMIAGAGITIGHYADYAAHVWDKDGKYYNLLKLDDRAEASKCSDEFVRNLARMYEDTADTCSCWRCVMLNREFHKPWLVIRLWKKLCKRRKDAISQR